MTAASQAFSNMRMIAFFGRTLMPSQVWICANRRFPGSPFCRSTLKPVPSSEARRHYHPDERRVAGSVAAPVQFASRDTVADEVDVDPRRARPPLGRMSAPPAKIGVGGLPPAGEFRDVSPAKPPFRPRLLPLGARLRHVPARRGL